MKKTAIALAAIIAASSSAMAADVTLYGKVDAGFAYSNTDLKTAGTNEKFSLDSGNNSGSRFGLKAREDLGNGYAVAFQLENGFSGDTGALGQEGRLFGREARLSLETPYGTASFGRMGALTSGMGTYDIFQAAGDSLDGGWGYNWDIGNWASRDRYDNMVTLVTPTFAGLTGYAQYSFGTDSVKEREHGAAKVKFDYDDSVTNERDTQRYYGLGVAYENGPLTAGLFYDSVLEKHWAGEPEPDDAKSLSLAFAYDFQVAKVTFGAQYGWDEAVNFFTAAETTGGVGPADGYRLHLGTIVPLPCGTLKAGVYYGDVEDDKDNKAKNFNVAIGHEYPWSKRTYSYIGVGYKNVKSEDKAGKTLEEENSFSAMLGVVHAF